jgi:hypothetical protein
MFPIPVSRSNVINPPLRIKEHLKRCHSEKYISRVTMEDSD